MLEEEGVLGDVVLKSYELGFLPVEKDVLSLELESSAKDIFLVSSLICSGTCFGLRSGQLLTLERPLCDPIC